MGDDIECFEYTDTPILFGSGCVISVVSCILCVIFFGSGWSCSYSSDGSPGGGCCTVCSHLAPAEVGLSLQC